MPEVEFVSGGWNGALRPGAPNLKIIPYPACLDFDYDAAIDDNCDLPSFKAKAKRKVWLQHNEWGGVDPLPRCLEAADACVVVSDHKRATMREHGLSPKVSTIGFGFDPKQWEVPAVERSGAGTTFNGMADPGRYEVRDFTAKINDWIPLTVIGHCNEGAPVHAVVAPYGFDAYKAELNKLAVWIYTIYGEQMGMSTYEAMMLGIPVVTASQPEAWNFLFDNWNCKITRRPPCDSVEWMADAAKELLADPARAKAMGEAGRRTVTERFPLKSVGEQYRKVLFG